MKKVFKILTTCILMMLALGVEAQAAHPKRLVDDANLLMDYEEEQLLEILDKTSENLDFDIVIVTANSTDGKSSRDYADDYFDYNGYGMGDDYDGVLLLINMGAREWYISTTGYGINVLSDSDLDYIGENVADYLSYEDYSEACHVFVSLVEDEVLEERDSATLDLGEILMRVAAALTVGGGLAFIPVTVMKKKLDNVNPRKEASDYVRSDKIVMTDQRDLYLYHTMHRRAKPKDTSSVHRGSSGSSHGGRGGSF